MNTKINVFLIEDHPEYREVIGMALGKDPGFELIDQFGTAERALRSLQEHRTGVKADVILLDIRLPGMSGVDAIPWIKTYSPDTKVIILSQSGAEADVLRAIQLGASGYLLKSSTVVQIKDGIRAVMEGGSPLDAAVARFILTTLKTSTPKDPPEQRLSDRELEILSLLAEGLMKKEIANRLGIGTSTVVTHVTHIYEKLNTSNAPSAIHQAHRLGLFPLDSDE